MLELLCVCAGSGTSLGVGKKKGFGGNQQSCPRMLCRIRILKESLRLGKISKTIKFNLDCLYPELCPLRLGFPQAFPCGVCQLKSIGVQFLLLPSLESGRPRAGLFYSPVPKAQLLPAPGCTSLQGFTNPKVHKNFH